MLQIASGKLFQSEPGQRNELRGIVYTNLLLHGRTIETEAGRLLPTDSFQNTKSLVYEFTELIEQAPEVGVVASHGLDPYLKDFSAIVSFVLNVTCTPDRDLTYRLTSGQPSPTSNVPPKQLIRRIFDNHVYCQDRDADRLVAFVRDIIGLRRKSYLAAIRAIRTYVTGLHRLADDFELAYTLLVASVESLAQKFDGHRAKWADYDQAKRLAIDKALANADKETARAVRNALLDIEHIALSRRFRDFTRRHLKPSFFREEAAGLTTPVGRTELPDTLREAYRLRSEYIHNLRELPRLLKLGVDYRETARIDGATLLTIQGMARLARHVITEFVAREPKVKVEEYDYHMERAGIVYLPPAPQYWIGNAKNLDSATGRKRLEGFLDQVAAWHSKEPNCVVTDMRDVLAKVSAMLPRMKKIERLPFLALYYVFNGIAPSQNHLPDFPMVKERYGAAIESPSVEAMLANLVLGVVPEWTLTEYEAVHDDYFKKRDKASGMKVARTLEAGLSLELAERHRAAGNPKRAAEFVSKAVENYPGNAALYELERTFDPKKKINWRNVVLKDPPQ